MIEDQGREQKLRLEGLYRAMGDEELVELASRPEDLTDSASEVLAAEMAGRGLDLSEERGADETDPDEPVGLPAAGDLMPENLGSSGPQIELITFHDAMAARRACEFLEQASIGFHVADVSEAREGRGSIDGGLPVALRITVGLEDVQRAQSALRRQMGLFPLENIAVPDEVVDDGTRASVGYFATRGEAEEIAGVLKRAGFWNEVLEDPELKEHAYSVQVREIDLFAAGDAVERALGVE